MSETSARASRFALAFGSLARNGLIGARATAAAAPDGVGVGVEVGVNLATGETGLAAGAAGEATTEGVEA